jgi:hypothetical protein
MTQYQINVDSRTFASVISRRFKGNSDQSHHSIYHSKYSQHLDEYCRSLRSCRC